MAGRYLQALGALSRVLSRPAVVGAHLAATRARSCSALPVLHEVELAPQLTVREIMTESPRTTRAETLLRDAARELVRAGIGALPVVEADGLLVGMLSERELMRHMLSLASLDGSIRARRSAAFERARRTVRDVMTRQVLCVSPDQPLAEVASLMTNKDVDRVPVVRGRPTGRLSHARRHRSQTHWILTMTMAGKSHAHDRQAGCLRRRQEPERSLRISRRRAFASAPRACSISRRHRPRSSTRVHRERPFFGSLVTFMTSGPCMPMVLEKADAVAALRKAIGATDPKEADAGHGAPALRRVEGAERDPRLGFRRERRARIPILLLRVGAARRALEKRTADHASTQRNEPSPVRAKGVTAWSARCPDEKLYPLLSGKSVRSVFQDC